MKTILFFDTETTGLPDDYKASYKHVDNWPRLVQLAWVLYNGDSEVGQGDYLVKPDGFNIPEEASDIHGHDHQKCMDEGEDIKTVLNKFWTDVTQSDVVIAHNIAFDSNIIASELFRNSAVNHAYSFMRKPMFCTMQSTTDFCKLPGKFAGSYKWPKLEELYEILFHEKLENTHDALVDIRATAKCFFELKKREVFK